MTREERERQFLEERRRREELQARIDRREAEAAAFDPRVRSSLSLACLVRAIRLNSYFENSET